MKTRAPPAQLYRATHTRFRGSEFEAATDSPAWTRTWPPLCLDW